MASRFYFTAPAGSRVAHICHARTHVEGNTTACARLTVPGWLWWSRAPRRVCKQCKVAARAA